MTTAFLYVGQGAQTPGMGKDIHEAFPVARRMFERISDATGRDVAALCFQGSEADLRKTDNAQIALFAYSMAAHAVLTAHALRPSFAAGHSLGQLTALAGAESVTVEEAARLVAARGRLMAAASVTNPGGMVAVIGASVGDVEEACAEAAVLNMVAVANDNSPRQIIISGAPEGVRQAAARLARVGARTVPLRVSGAFHTPLMADAASAFAALLDTVNVGSPVCPIVANSDAALLLTAGDISDEMRRHMLAPVQWRRGMLRMIEVGATDFVEIGPGRTLTQFALELDRSLRVRATHNAVALRRTVGE